MPPLFSHFLRCVDFVNVLVTVADPCLLYRLRLVSRFHQEIVDKYLRLVFDIDKFLQRRFVPDAVAFRSMMAQTGCVIAGRTALEFFARTEREDTPMELFVDTTKVTSVSNYLVSTCGYFVEPMSATSPEHQAYNPKGWGADGLWSDYATYCCAVIRFTRSYKGKCRQVLLSFPPLTETVTATTLYYPTSKSYNLPSCHVTHCLAAALLNVITANNAFCPFPSATFGRRKSLLLSRRHVPAENYRSQELCTFCYDIGLEIERAYVPGPEDLVIPEAAVYFDDDPVHKRYAVGMQRKLEDHRSWVISFDVTALNEGKFLASPKQWHNEIHTDWWRVNPAPLGGESFLSIASEGEREYFDQWPAVIEPSANLLREVRNIWCNAQLADTFLRETGRVPREVELSGDGLRMIW